MPYLNLFDEISSIGNKFLKSTDRGHQVLKKYLWQLGSINDLMKHTHSLVIEKLETIENALTLEEAKESSNQLQGDALTDSFRTSGLCDIFVGMGISLRKIIETPQHTAQPEEEVPLTVDEINKWMMFCNALEEREQQVAYLYSSEIDEIGRLTWNLNNQGDLGKIKEYAIKAKRILTSQMADFDSLSVKFKEQLN